MVSCDSSACDNNRDSNLFLSRFYHRFFCTLRVPAQHPPFIQSSNPCVPCTLPLFLAARPTADNGSTTNTKLLMTATWSPTSASFKDGTDKATTATDSVLRGADVDPSSILIIVVRRRQRINNTKRLMTATRQLSPTTASFEDGTDKATTANGSVLRGGCQPQSDNNYRATC